MHSASPTLNPLDLSSRGIRKRFYWLSTMNPVLQRLTLALAYREKLRAGAYPTMDAWKRDVALIWSNCRKYNGEAHPVSKMAEKLEAAMERRMDEAVAAATQQLAQRGDSSKGGKGLKPSREVAALKQSAPLSDDDQEDIKPTLHRVVSAIYAV